MSYFTGTATDYADLLVKLHDHLTSGLPTAQQWVVHYYRGWRDLVASSHLDNYEPGKGVDADPETAWLTAQGNTTGTFALHMLTDLDLRQLAITPQENDRAPSAFDLQYSSDGTTWTTLQSFSAITWSGRQVFDVTATSPGAQPWWRLNVTANGGDASYMGFTQLELLETGTYGLINHGEAGQLYAHGPDGAGASMPYIGIQLYRSTTLDIYNWRSMAADGFNPAASILGQPNGSTVLGTPLWNGSITYHLAANGRRFVLLMNFAGAWETIYAGLHLRRLTPGQYPYPCALLASLTSDSLTRYSDTSRVSGWKGNRANCAVKDEANQWTAPDIWPFNNGITRRDSGGWYPLEPLVLNQSAGILGELEGLYHVSGFNNIAGNTVTIGTDTYLVVPDIQRIGINDYVALLLD